MQQRTGAGLPDLLTRRGQQKSQHGGKVVKKLPIREATAASTDDDEDEVVELDPMPKGPNLCRLPFFYGCTLCTVEEDDLVTRRPQVIEKLSWSKRCGAKVDDHVEEIDDGASADESPRSEFDDLSGQQYRVLPSASEATQDPLLRQELDAFFWSAPALFAEKKWTIQHMNGERYKLNGRSIRMWMTPFNVPVYFGHLTNVVEPAIAERASHIRVADGPLHQPLLDYLLHTGQNESYDERGTENIAIVTGDGRMLDFNVAPTEDRLFEMKSAKIQADMRRHVGGEFARVSALQSEGSKLLGGTSCRGPPGHAGGRLS